MADRYLSEDGLEDHKLQLTRNLKRVSPAAGVICIFSPLPTGSLSSRMTLFSAIPRSLFLKNKPAIIFQYIVGTGLPF
jgi:hypothetical protein